MKQEQKYRYQIRNEIEQTIKLYHINRNDFHEADKFNYNKIIRKFYYTFCDYPRYHAKPEQIEINYLWTNFRKNLQYLWHISCAFDSCDSWKLSTSYIKNATSDKEQYYFLTYCGWLYEGTIDCILQLLEEHPFMIYEFYIFPKDYHFAILYDEDSECLRMCCHSNK